MDTMGVKFINYFPTLIGFNGFNFSFVVREKDNPDANGYFHNFIDNMIACAALKGE